MIIGYDPVAFEVELELENGRPRLDLSTDLLVVKYYTEDGILFAELSPHAIELGILPERGSQVIIPRIVSTGPQRWRVELHPQDE